jgi:hypothetical protein
MAHDASHYLLTPQAVVTPSGVPQMSALLNAAARAGVPLAFRSGGTSLSGQAGTQHILVDTRRSEFNTYRTLESAILVLPSGTVLNTADADGDQHLAHHEPALHRELLRLRDRVRAAPSSATAAEAEELSARPLAAYASTNRTCEIGMTRASGQPYQHILELLDAATR